MPKTSPSSSYGNEDWFETFDFDDMDDGMQAADIASSQDQHETQDVVSPTSTEKPSPAQQPAQAANGQEEWKTESERCLALWVTKHDIEGYAGMIGTVRNAHRGAVDDSIVFGLDYEDIEGDSHSHVLELIRGKDLESYPASYTLSIAPTGSYPRRASKIFQRFAKIYSLTLPQLLQELIFSLQGDDEATGGEPDGESEEDGDGDSEESEEGWVEYVNDKLVSRGATDEVPEEWTKLKRHFEQAKSWGYRPGLTRISDYWVISYSILLRNLPIDPNTLAHWDDALVDAWNENQRLVLMMGVGEYPPKVEKMRFWMGLHRDYKPPKHIQIETTRGSGLPSFFLSSSLLSHIKSFGRCYTLQTQYGLDWDTANEIGIDEDAFHVYVWANENGPGNEARYGRASEAGKGEKREGEDPVARGFGDNVPLCAFYWNVKRFVDAPKYCMICGSKVETITVRPYVCSKSLCLYGFMSLGIGPPFEHTILTHPFVVDLLLSFAHASASTKARMEMPTRLHIVVPAEFGMRDGSGGRLLDELNENEQMRAVAWLIERLPRVSAIKVHLEAGGKINQLACPAGSIGILRWVIGTCRAYLKETREGEGVVNTRPGPDSPQSSGDATGTAEVDVRQFTFVVGNPEQERDFKGEVEEAKKRDGNIERYPSILAFHGSAVERWHNILRVGLDFQEIANARAFGHGVYLASDASISEGTYSRVSTMTRGNADFAVRRATALVELVNVPESFVSRDPYYVVKNTKQIKPFLLLVQGTLVKDTFEDGDGDDIAAAAIAAPAPAPASALVDTVSKPSAPRKNSGSQHLFVHDPNLKRPTSYYGQPLRVNMPPKLNSSPVPDIQPDDEIDHAILNPIIPSCPGEQHGGVFEPTLQDRIAKLATMPPPSETSVVASKALGKEFRALVKAQAEGKLPFYVDPDTDSLYCWLIELHQFPPSALVTDMQSRNVKSIIAEIRFPASFPHAPPFMRILHPRCLQFTRGGGGNITAGGSVCNEIMTTSGWNPAFCVEAIVRDVMVNMTEASPPARLDPQQWDTPYGLQEAVQAYRRVAADHGWDIPKGFDQLST